MNSELLGPDVYNVEKLNAVDFIAQFRQARNLLHEAFPYLKAIKGSNIRSKTTNTGNFSYGWTYSTRTK